MLDTDDWYYIYYGRKAIPVLNDWNPARVFPEILMPACSELAAYLFYPILKDYILSLTIGFAITVSLFIAVYFFLFVKLLGKNAIHSTFFQACMAGLFFLFHFSIFRTAFINNRHMFFSQNATCYFYYLIPALLNCSLVMWMMTENFTEDFFNGEQIGKKSAFILCAYLAIFSNLYQSIVLPAYCAASLVLAIKEAFPLKENCAQFIRKKAIYLLIITAWFISATMEIGGGRAASLASGISFQTALKNTIRIFLKNYNYMNKSFLLLVGIVLLENFAAFILRRKAFQEASAKYRGIFFQCVLTGTIVLVFLILICAKTGAERIQLPDILFGFVFFAFFIIIIACITCMERHPNIKLVLPVFLVILIFETNTHCRTFAEPNILNLDPVTCKAVSDDIAEQIIDAAKDGKSEMVLYVMDADTDDNWPHAMYASQRFASALHKHGIIPKPITITMEPSEEFNRKHQLG